MKRNIIITACVLILAFVAGMSGFTLAQPDAAKDLGQGKLIGAFVTTEYLDLFDVESYLNDNISKMTGGELTIDGNDSKYQGRLYAALTDKTPANEDAGKYRAMHEYVFGDVEGFSYICYDEYDENGTCAMIYGDEAISDQKNAVSITGEGENITLDGTIYVAPSTDYATYFVNPVYQTSDGQVYAMSGMGMTFSGDMTEGMSFNKTIKDSETTTENREKNVYSASVKISVSIIYPPELVCIIQFNSEDQALSLDEYLPDNLPDEITPEQDCSYIILEEYKTSPDGDKIVGRRLYEQDDNTLESFILRDDGVCVNKSTKLNWTILGM